MLVSFYRNGPGANHDIDLNAEEITALLLSQQFVLNELCEDDMDQQKVVTSVFKKEPGRTILLIVYELLKYPRT